MASWPSHPPVIAIVGETASGKSALAMELAEQFNGEIIAADSRTIYKGMDIGTAKPSADDQVKIRHHMLDIITPDQSFSAAAFQGQAEAAIADIVSRGKIPFLVGGTGLYADSVMYGFTFRKPADLRLRVELASKTVDVLQHLLIERGIALPENARNPRHLIRTLETGGEQPQRQKLRPDSLIIGMSLERTVLTMRVRARVNAMIEQGLIEEVRQLAEQYGWDAPGLRSPGYAEFASYFQGSADIRRVQDFIVQHHLQLAKRQRTWFKRNPDIYHICKKEEAVELITTLLNNSYTASD